MSLVSWLALAGAESFAGAFKTEGFEVSLQAATILLLCCLRSMPFAERNYAAIIPRQTLEDVLITGICEADLKELGMVKMKTRKMALKRLQVRALVGPSHHCRSDQFPNSSQGTLSLTVCGTLPTLEVQ